MENSEKIFTPFPSDRICKYSNPDIIHFDHPACCRNEEFTTWRESYLKPMLEWEYMNPLPPFRRIRRCIKELSTHKDNSYCCNEDVKHQYNIFINKNFKLLPLTYVNDLTWSKMRQYHFADSFRSPLQQIHGAKSLK